MSDDKNITELKRARGYAKGSITRIKSFIKDLPLTENITLSALKVRKSRLEMAFSEYNDVCRKIKMLTDTDEEDPGEIEDMYIDLLATIDDTISSLSGPQAPPGHTVTSKIKLPNIILPTFNGKYSEFYEFYNMFYSVIGSDATKPPVQKFYYLKSFLAGEPLALVSNLPLTDSSYEEAIKLLKQRYENVFQITSEHINVLLDINSILKSTPVELRAFVSTCKQQLAALKNLGQKVSEWDSILICLLSKKLDLYTRRAFQLERDQATNPTMEEFLAFLEKRSLALENTESTVSSTAHHKSQKLASNVVSTSSKVQASSTCFYCKSNHKIFACPAFKLASLEKRLEAVAQNKLCKICLNPHIKKCRYHFKCNVCKQAHNTLLHKDEPVAGAAPSVTLMSGMLHGQVLLPTARVKLYSKTGTVITCRALLDSGSQASFITQRLADLLGTAPSLTNSHIIGVTNAEQTITHSTNIEVHSLVYPFKIHAHCHVVPEITTKLPQKQFDISHIKLPDSSQLADTCFNEPGDVHLLLGADIFFQVLLPKPEVLSDASTSDPEQPTLLHTSFGYIVAGRVASRAVKNEVVSLFCKACDNNISESLCKLWQADQVVEVYPEKCSEYEYTEQHFKENVVLKNNQFQVSMPLKVPLDQVNEELGDSFHLALSRFINLEKRFRKDPKLFEDYKKFIDQYISLGHGQYIDINQYDLTKDPVYFLPHHPVIREDNKTTKLRVVFDASLKTNKKISLNNILMNGPVVQKDLFDVLIAFRLHKYFFITDIKMMFRLVLLDPEQRSLQNILWRDQPDENIKCIQLQTVTYGLKTSSYLATRCLIELAQRLDNQLPSAASILKNNTYVDDILFTHHNPDALVQIKDELIHLLSLGGFQLHKWASNCENILIDIPEEKQHFGEVDLNKDDLSVKTLGVHFDMRTDTFMLSTSQPYTATQHSKKEILSYISTFFDPLGLMGPIFVQAKTIMQMLWAANVGWEEAPPENIKKLWIEFVNSLSEMEPVRVPRCVNLTDCMPTIQLIGFADASLTAHGCCLYLRVVDNDGKVGMKLLCSKSRINPLKQKLTIPKLELNAALLLAKLADKVLTNLRPKISVQLTHLFIDSQIVLSWINSEIAKLNTYAANRVRVIQKLSSQNCCQWGYVETNDNPADCISRGLLPHELKDHQLWWHGPSRLHNKNVCLDTAYEAPATSLLDTTSESDNIESSAPVVCTVAAHNSDCIIEQIKKKFSNINTMVRVLAYVQRFCSNLKRNSVKCTDDFLHVDEISRSLLLLIKSEQEKYFSKEIRCIKSGERYNGSLKPLSPFIGQDGVLRVSGRLQHSPLPYSTKHPIILPKNSPVTVLIIRYEHNKLLHAGQKLVLSSLNQRYWITDGLRTVKKVIHKCTICFRLKAAASNQLMGSLPADRVNPCRPFEKVGMDFAGPISVKMSRVRRAVIGKGYILVFVCFVTKAIHLELASDLTTDTFLSCFKRFIARRNVPSDVYCDNASTFKGAKARLGELYRLSRGDQAQVQSYAAERGIKFHFIPSYSPVFGGLWESSVKSVKHHLKHVMGRALLAYEQINTILTEIEAILNSRPISAMSADPTDFAYLTPGHFLTGAPLNSFPEQDVSDAPTNRLKFWSICTSIKQSFWKYWKNIYLTTLQSRPKWQNVMPNITVGTLVILRELNVPPMQWPMARVTKVFPGADDIVRAVEVKTQNGHSHRRSITKVCILPIES